MTPQTDTPVNRLELELEERRWRKAEIDRLANQMLHTHGSGCARAIKKGLALLGSAEYHRNELRIKELANVVESITEWEITYVLMFVPDDEEDVDFDSREVIVRCPAGYEFTEADAIDHLTDLHGGGLMYIQTISKLDE